MSFLLGDAGHIHSPVGGQGMNTGIGDAINLAWKLRDALSDRSEAVLLDTYETERITFAQKLVKSTDQVFTFVTANSRLANFIRLTVVPCVIPLLFRFRAVRRFLFLTISQLGIKYPQSALSQGRAGKLRGGDGLPWADDNFEYLKTLDWQVHCYGDIPATITQWCKEHSLPIHRLDWSKAAARAGFTRNALYVVRPDGYLALVQTKPDLTEWTNYFSAGMTFRLFEKKVSLPHGTDAG